MRRLISVVFVVVVICVGYAYPAAGMSGKPKTPKRGLVRDDKNCLWCHEGAKRAWYLTGYEPRAGGMILEFGNFFRVAARKHDSTGNSVWHKENANSLDQASKIINDYINKP